jgi:exonuclease SbcD
MRLLLAPDLHAWYESPGPVEARINEWRACAWRLLEIAQAERCRYALFPGDLWVSNRPSPAQVLATVELFRAFTEAGIPVISIAGNHDVGAPEQPNFVSVLGSMHPTWGVTTPQVIRPEPDLAIACMPWTKGGTEDQLSAILHGLVAELHEGPEKPRYQALLAHWPTDLSTYSSGESAVGREPCLRLADLQTLPVDLIVLGHIHRPERLSDRPPILHTGALTRRDFGEQDDDRLAATVDLASGLVKWHPLPARAFVTVDPLARTRPSVADAYVRLVYRATEEAAARIDHDALVREMQAAGAFHVAGVFPEIVRTDRGRAEGLTEATDPLQALETWLQLQSDLTEETRARVRTAAAELLTE